ncbi:MAG: PhzF family phenazine biosynthesis protein [Candidatus Bathyarchaeota archaeon]|nr:MAG: PhzF family phenazine biosynthesis protein [Candidatus Bathyarchaeota archaeon]
MVKTARRAIPIYQVDAFTDEAFKGNPAAVCILQNKLKSELMAKIASEMKLSETAFTYPLGNKSLQETKAFSLRWFTPRVEVSLCGHATLATAAVLFREIKVNANEIEFRTKSGNLAAKEDRRGIRLGFPSDNPTSVKTPSPLLRAVGVKNFTNVLYGRNTKSLLIHLSSEEDVHNLKPDYRLMESTTVEKEIESVIVTAKGSHPYDFISRFFSPWIGINEDPVTGAAHTVLAPYWSKLLNKNEMRAYQASTRGGELTVRLKPDNIVELIGNAVVVLKGRLMI